ncbi:ACT domain-containing protein [Vibrio metschnikovii]|uniref:ACT domain-containing protein n=1 Tax=Vibrio metschnikovii TaxID=28172 RepID=UPI001C2FAA0D|nr:ACT domain-containing protein [Vibrio metschnikovii]
MSAISELEVLLKSMSLQIIEGNYVFCTVKGPLSEYWHLDPIATCREQEGLTLVLLEQQAKAAQLKFDSVFSLITLTVHSSLEAVGLTAAFTTKLASYGVSANVIAGYYHDHIFVQSTLAEKALQALQEFTQQTGNENTQ